MVAGLLTQGGRVGGRVVGAVGINVRTGKFVVCRAKATVLCTSRPTRLWLFAPESSGISEFRPPECTGDGHAIGWRAGLEFTMLEKSLRAEWSGLRSFPPYSTGNNHNSWYACTMVDAEGREIPWLDRDGRVLATVAERHSTGARPEVLPQGRGRAGLPALRVRRARDATGRGVPEAGIPAPVFCRPDQHARDGAAGHSGG